MENITYPCAGRVTYPNSIGTETPGLGTLSDLAYISLHLDVHLYPLKKMVNVGTLGGSVG